MAQRQGRARGSAGDASGTSRRASDSLFLVVKRRTKLVQFIATRELDRECDSDYERPEITGIEGHSFHASRRFIEAAFSLFALERI